MNDYSENQDGIKWLLDGPSYIQYRTKIDLLEQDESDSELQLLKKNITKDPAIAELLNEIITWPGLALKRHNDAKHLLHKLVFLADIGLTKEVEQIDAVAKLILKQQSEEGQFRTLLHVHERYGGSGEDGLNWMLCDSPLLLYFLIKIGYAESKQVENAASHLISFIRDNGWPCKTSANYKGFRGPGRKDDPCPYATLISLRALSQIEKWRNDEILKQATNALLDLWEQRKTKRAYLFGMGTDFKKLKAPLIWYDVLHFTEVLSHLNWTHKDSRFLEIIEVLKSKIDSEGKCTAESVWRAWNSWDFGQKREPSRWITFLVYKVLKRLN